MNEDNTTNDLTESVEHPITTTNIPPSNDLLNDIGGLLPIFLILLTIAGSIFGFNFLKNTKKLKLDQKIKSSNHKENVKNTEINAVELDKITKNIIENVKELDKIAENKTSNIQDNINSSVKNINNINNEPQSISDTKKRLKNALNKLGENK